MGERYGSARPAGAAATDVRFRIHHLLVPQLLEVSSIALVSLDDTRARDRRPGSFRGRAWPGRPLFCCLWSRSLVLLFVASASHPRTVNPQRLCSLRFLSLFV